MSSNYFNYDNLYNNSSLVFHSIFASTSAIFTQLVFVYQFSINITFHAFLDTYDSTVNREYLSEFFQIEKNNTIINKLAYVWSCFRPIIIVFAFRDQTNERFSIIRLTFLIAQRFCTNNLSFDISQNHLPQRNE